jgi:hypothetical protein
MALVFIVLGSILIVINIVGMLRGSVSEVLPPGRAAVDGYHFRRFSPALAQARFRVLKTSNLPDSEKIKELFELISGSIIHRKYRISVFDNWLLKIAGVPYPQLLNTQNARLLWKRGAGKCDQASLLLVAKAKELGISAKILGLDGHVLAETECENGKQVVDADMGLLWDCGIDMLTARTEPEIAGAYKKRGFSEDQASHNAGIIANSSQWTCYGFPPAKRRYQAEQFSNWLIWLLPVLLVLYGVLRE